MNALSDPLISYSKEFTGLPRCLLPRDAQEARFFAIWIRRWYGEPLRGSDM